MRMADAVAQRVPDARASHQRVTLAGVSKVFHEEAERRARACGRRRGLWRSRGRAPDHRRAQRLRQEHTAEHHRRARRTDIGPRSRRRRRGTRSAAILRVHVSKGPPVPVATRPRQRRHRPRGPRNAARRSTGEGARHSAAFRPGRLRREVPGAALGTFLHNPLSKGPPVPDASATTSPSASRSSERRAPKHGRGRSTFCGVSTWTPSPRSTRRSSRGECASGSR